MLNALTLSNIKRFSKFFHCQNQEKICNNNVKKRSHHTSSVSLHYLLKCQKVTVSVGVSRMGKTVCQHVLGGSVQSNIHARCQRYSWTVQQDGALSYIARNTLTYPRRENVTFIEHDMWPPNSPNLNPVDCTVWGALQQMVYQRRRFTTINQLKQAIVIEWSKLSQPFIDHAIGQWRRRLECVIQQQGGHIKHLM